MGKFAEALASDKKRPGSRCEVGAALTEDKLDDEDRAELTAALAPSSGVPYAAITRSLRAAGYKVGADAVGRHVAEECACGRTR